MSKKDIKVSITLPKEMDELAGHNSLLKALLLHSSGDIHSQESFEDPAMIDVQYKILSIQKRIYKEMLEEIADALDEDYT